MNRFNLTRPVLLLSTTVFLAVLLALTAPASAEYWWTHGHSGAIEYPDRVTEDFVGWGLRLDQNSGTSNWIHYAVPTWGDTTKGARYIRIRCYFGSNDIFIDNIHIYNGGTRIATFGTNYSASNASRTITVDLGSVRNFNYGLGVSINIAAGVEMSSHRIEINGVGANFVTIP